MRIDSCDNGGQVKGVLFLLTPIAKVSDEMLIGLYLP